jgi:hypothetical protein
MVQTFERKDVVNHACLETKLFHYQRVANIIVHMNPTLPLSFQLCLMKIKSFLRSFHSYEAYNVLTCLANVKSLI